MGLKLKFFCGLWTPIRTSDSTADAKFKKGVFLGHPSVYVLKKTSIFSKRCFGAVDNADDPERAFWVPRAPGGSPPDERPATGSHPTLLSNPVKCTSASTSVHSPAPVPVYVQSNCTRAPHQLWAALVLCDQLEQSRGCSVEAKREEVGRMR